MLRILQCHTILHVSSTTFRYTSLFLRTQSYIHKDEHQTQIPLLSDIDLGAKNFSLLPFHIY